MPSQNDNDQIDPLQVQLDKIKGIFQENPSSWINGTAIGFVPSASDPNQVELNPPVAPAPQILLFVDPGAPDCERAAIQSKAQQEVPGVQVLRVSRFLGLQATNLVSAGDSIGTYVPFRYNLPLVNAGTLGARVVANNQEFGLSSNHVLAHNGRAIGAPILSPGPIDDEPATPVIGLSSNNFIPFEPATWPYQWPAQPPFNSVDCALFKSPRSGTINAPTTLTIFPLSSVSATDLLALSQASITKKGRATRQTSSFIRIFYLSTHIGFTFGTYYFQGLLGTYDDNHKIFAAPGDSGGVAVFESSAPPQFSNQGIGLITARAYAFDNSGQFLAYIIAICSLETVANELAAKMNLQPSQLEFSI